MGVVYRARQESLERDVCIKFLSTELSGREEFRLQFEREAKTLARLSHPNVLAIHDFGVHEGSCYLVTEYVEGGNLLELRLDRALTTDEVAGIVAGIGRGVAHIHRRGVVHRDLKPSNILVSDAGEVKIVDFGIAADAATGRARGASESPGTLRCCAPEIIVGRSCDQKADQFSLAMTLFVFVTGKYPECGEKVSRLNRAIPAAADSVLDKGMSLDPEDRYSSVESFCCALVAALLGLPEAPATLSRCPIPESEFHHGIPAPAPDPTPATDPCRIPLPPAPAAGSSRKWLAAAAASVAGVVLATGVLVHLLMSPRTSSSSQQATVAQPVFAGKPSPALPVAASPVPIPAPTPTATPAPLPEGFIAAAAVSRNVGKGVVLVGTVVSVRDSWSERAPNILTLQDSSGVTEIVFWKAMRERIPPGLLAPGTQIVVGGKAGVYRDRPQVQLAAPDAIVRAEQDRLGTQVVTVLGAAQSFAGSNPGG